MNQSTPEIFKYSPTITLVLLLGILISSCSKEDNSVEYFDANKSYDIVTPEPLIQSFVALLTEENIESIYMPEYAFRSLDIPEENRKDYLRSSKLILLYSPEHHQSFENFFGIESDNSWNNITYLREDKIGSDYPFIAPEELQSDINNIADTLSSEFPEHQDTITRNKLIIEERINTLDEYSKAAFEEVSVDGTRFIVESKYMKQWLEAYLPGVDKTEIVVVEELLNRETFDLEQYLDDSKDTILISTSLESKEYFQPSQEIDNLVVIQFNVFKDGYKGPDSYFENMVQNIKLLTLSLYSLS